MIDVADMETEPLPAVSLADVETQRLPATLARDLALRCWLYLLCERSGGFYDGSLAQFQQDARLYWLEVDADDMRRLHGQTVGVGRLDVLVCEDRDYVHIFAAWEDKQ